MALCPIRPPACSTDDSSSYWILLGPVLLLLGLFPTLAFALPSPVIEESEAPRVRALLAQAWASESGRGLRKNRPLASLLYRQAGLLGNAEGYYRSGRIQLSLGRSKAHLGLAACLFSSASQLGHNAAQTALDSLTQRINLQTLVCAEHDNQINLFRQFDLNGYLTGLPPQRQHIVRLITRISPLYGIDPRLALAIATVESNLDPWAVSPKQAMGVMQLIPSTAERFNVAKPFDAEQNIRGGLAYLRWLQHYYAGDTVRVLAAYNAGEKAVDRYGGIPPYQETMLYVARVLGYSGRSFASVETQGKTAKPH